MSHKVVQALYGLSAAMVIVMFVLAVILSALFWAIHFLFPFGWTIG